MIIAIDYDDTYSADPPLWDRFIEDAKSKGHEVHMVSCRRDTAQAREECRIPGLRFFEHHFTSMASKRWHMENKCRPPVKVDVWIDDLPESVKEGR